MDSEAFSQDLAETSEVGKFQAGRVKEISFQELQKATDGFRDENILGRGGFGIVYKGCLLDGSLVAIKRLIQEKNTPEGKQQFHRELEMIGLAVHRNLLRLYGFCITPTECLLVYPYMANGSVADRLKGKQESLASLSWPSRVNVAYGVAKALSYLHDHCNPKIIHRDVKADNVLLDDDYEAVVADFGLVRLMNYKDSHVTTGVCGTIGHIAPEYFTNLRCSEKTDVYGYGILLLELITGKRVYNLIPPSKRDETMLFDWISELVKNKELRIFVDSNLQGNYAFDEVEVLIGVALLCTQYSPKERPQMSKVLRMLEDHRSNTEAINRGSLRNPTKLQQEKIRCFLFYRLEYATNYFSENNVLARGSFGKVYKGRLEDGTLVTVKRLEEHTRKGELQFQAEALVTKYKIKHPNLLPVLGFCNSEKERILVYPFMKKGTLASYLKGYPKSAQFYPQTQKKIALGVARGICHLHYKYSGSTIHGDLKAENIWLDESFNSVIGDIGWYHPEDSSLDTAISTSPGYTAPEYLQTNKCTKKTDVFAYGVLLLELLTGLKASEFYQLSLEGKKFVQGNMLVNVVRFCLREFGYAGLNDCKLISYDALRKDETEQLIQLALICTQNSDTNRPKMSKVVVILEGDEWPRLHKWREVMKEVDFQKDIGKKEVYASHGNGTADDKQRVATLKSWIREFPTMSWWSARPPIDRFPYLKEIELSTEILDGNLNALRGKYAGWFGERLHY